MKQFIDKIKNKEELSFEESKTAFELLMGGKANELEIFDFLTLLSAKGEVSNEIVDCVFKSPIQLVANETYTIWTVCGDSATGARGSQDDAEDNEVHVSGNDGTAFTFRRAENINNDKSPPDDDDNNNDTTHIPLIPQVHKEIPSQIVIKNSMLLRKHTESLSSLRDKYIKKRMKKHIIINTTFGSKQFVDMLVKKKRTNIDMTDTDKNGEV